MPTKPMNQAERISRAAKPMPNGCCEWQLSKDSAGYGRLKISLGTRALFRTTSAHRYAWEIWRGEIPEGMSVLHRCDNRACINPDHLFLGTQRDNILDMHVKGRGPRGYKRRDPSICAANARKRKCK